MKEKSSIPINQEEIATYLKDIRKIKVMTPERERELAQRILSGNVTLVEKKQIEREYLTQFRQAFLANPYSGNSGRVFSAAVVTMLTRSK